ncbi:hypothetical protein ACNKHR_21600 [Shigella flexneri]
MGRSLLASGISSLQLYIASGASLLLSAYALTLPNIPLPEKSHHIACQQAGSGCLRAV